MADIDALFGSLTFNQASLTFKSPINFDFKTSSKYKIICKTSIVSYDNKILYVKDLIHYRIGYLETIAGNISLFYVSLNQNKNNTKANLFIYLKDIYNSLYECNICQESIKIGSISANKINFVLKIDHIAAFFNFIKEYSLSMRNHENDFLYLETFGNKDKMSMTNVSHKNIVNNLGTILNFQYSPDIQIDLALSISRNNSVIFLHPNFFNNLIYNQKYSLFFNNYFLNVNSKLFTLKNNILSLCSASIKKN